MTDLDDMEAFDRLPPWAKQVLHTANRKFKAAEILSAVEGGSITPFNIRGVLANAEQLAKQRERKGYR